MCIRDRKITEYFNNWPGFCRNICLSWHKWKHCLKRYIYIYLHFNKQYKGFASIFVEKKHVESKRVFLSLPHITLLHGPFLLCYSNPVFSRNLFYSGTALICSITSFPGILSIQELFWSAASRLFQKSRLSRNCSALQHPIFSRNLDYPGTALLCSIPSFPEI